MQRRQSSYATVVFFSLIILLGLVSFTLCFAAEFRRSKKSDLRLNGKLCYLPGSRGFGLGIAALILLVSAQIIGTLFICNKFWSRNHDDRRICKTKSSNIIIIALLLSWISFGFAAILIGAATSMSQSQQFGKGWLDGNCYIVKDGVYIGAAVLMLITLALTISSAIMTYLSKIQCDQQGIKQPESTQGNAVSCP
ncbi:OLC1v1021788C1 [Oldenlandia corymbosa var. corymbosa]|uniref:OLC1v1021788C1 n=1 Tax=Oldenlandia corymbosa var. corymbosa TaxID=529605 RepID=A0AAV1BWG5_OLDCO|nr:OLC1v1021788C1 [Oldenlandia corymbosa var. corymbosa]